METLKEQDEKTRKVIQSLQELYKRSPFNTEYNLDKETVKKRVVATVYSFSFLAREVYTYLLNRDKGEDVIAPIKERVKMCLNGFLLENLTNVKLSKEYEVDNGDIFNKLERCLTNEIGLMFDLELLYLALTKSLGEFSSTVVDYKSFESFGQTSWVLVLHTTQLIQALEIKE